MKKIALFGLGLSSILLAGCGQAAPDAGQTGVLIDKPWFFGHGGVEDEPVTTGRSFTAISTDIVYINMQPQSFSSEYDDIMSSDGIPLSFGSTVTLQVTDPVLIVKSFSGGLPDWKCGDNMCPAWYENNLYPALNNYVRDAFKDHDMHSLAIESTGTNAAEVTIKTRLEAYIAAHNIPVKVINFTLGRVNPPQDIKTQRIQTAEQQQRQQTEIETAKAEGQRKAAEQARAEADNAYRNAMDLSPEQFVELQRIQMQNNACKDQKCTLIMGNAQAIVSSK